VILGEQTSIEEIRILRSLGQKRRIQEQRKKESYVCNLFPILLPRQQTSGEDVM
jgi:hypothetical protein